MRINFFRRKRFPARRAKNIKMLILDVDGVMTDGKIIISSGGEETKNFNVYDGVGINLGREQGLGFAVITARKSGVTLLRAEELGIEDVFQVSGRKLSAYQQILKKHGLTYAETAYIGDDLHDAELLKRAGLSVTPANARPGAVKYAHYITRAGGGEGAVREVVELILASRGKNLVLKSALIFFFAALVFSCSADRGPFPDLGREASASPEAGEKVEGGFRYTSTEKGALVLEIEGESAEGLGAEDYEIFIVQPRVKWLHPGSTVHARADSGVFDRGVNDMLFLDNAHVDYGGGGEISADIIKWESSLAKLTAEGSVKGEFLLEIKDSGAAHED